MYAFSARDIRPSIAAWCLLSRFLLGMRDLSIQKKAPRDTRLTSDRPHICRVCWLEAVGLELQLEIYLMVSNAAEVIILFDLIDTAALEDSYVHSAQFVNKSLFLRSWVGATQLRHVSPLKLSSRTLTHTRSSSAAKEPPLEEI